MVNVVEQRQIEDVRFEVFEVEPNALYQIVKTNLYDVKIEAVWEEYNKFDAMRTYFREVTKHLEEVVRKKYE